MVKDEDISSELGRTFDSAAMGYLSRAGAGPDDWAMAQEVNRRSREQLLALNGAFNLNYSERVASTERRLLEESIQRRVDHPAPRGFGTGPSKNFHEDAKRLVRLAHEADLASVRDSARQQMNVLLERALSRRATPSILRDAFSQASEGLSRNQPSRPKHSQE
jgi:hypothetical protein